MKNRLLKRTTAKDVFDKISEEDDPVDETDSADDSEVADDTDVADGADEEGADEEAAAPSRPTPWRRRLVVAAAGVIFLAAVGSAAVFGWQLKQRVDTAAAGSAAQAVAQSYAVTLTSIDTNDVDKNFTQVLDGATGEFKDMYSQSAAELRQLLIDNKAVSRGIVIDSGITSATKTRVEVLLFVDQSITNAINPEPRLDRSRVAMTMELVDNRWLASKVEIK